jgi:Mrp family chromosome partitioning ATPase
VLDELLVMADGTPARTVVVAQAAPVESGLCVTSALTAEAARRGLRALGAVLRVESGSLQIEPAADSTSAQSAGALRHRRLRVEGELRSHTDDVLGWLAEMAASHDLVLIDAPPLTQSSVGALLASVCDGLLILARAGVTAKHELRNATAIARSARCHTFGVFVDEPRGQLPSWLAGL